MASMHAEDWLLSPVHGCIGKRGAGNCLWLCFVKALGSVCRRFEVCLGCASGSERQAGANGPGLTHKRRLHSANSGTVM